MSPKSDILTGENFFAKRRNQRFARAENRIKFNNIKANKIRAEKAIIDKPLHVNFRILEDILTDKTIATVHRQFLLGKGFSFGVHTHLEMYNSKKCYAVYKYIILESDNDQIKIVKK